MSDEPRHVREVKEFNGLFLQDNPHDLPEGGAADQVNMKSTETGAIESRLGVRLVSGDT